LVHNEQVKLTATWLNTLAAAIITTGVVAPVVGLLFGFSGTAAISKVAIAAACGAWLLIGVILHLVARYTLGRLRP
jgi:hypothetical protein